jgi:hypothetical protein
MWNVVQGKRDSRIVADLKTPIPPIASSTSNNGVQPSNDEASAIEPDPTTGFFAPIETLKHLTPYPISLLATLAQLGWILGGSRAVPGASISSSDFDIFGSSTATRNSMQDALCVLSFAGIKWNNSLQRLIDDVKISTQAIIPYEIINRLARRLPSHTHSTWPTLSTWPTSEVSG